MKQNYDSNLIVRSYPRFAMWGLAATLVVLVGTVIGLVSGVMWQEANRPASTTTWTEYVYVTCHSASEDSTPYDCDYDGATNTWTPRLRG